MNICNKCGTELKPKDFKKPEYADAIHNYEIFNHHNKKEYIVIKISNDICIECLIKILKEQI